AGRYLLTDTVASGPAMYDTTRLNPTTEAHNSNPDPSTRHRRPAADAGLRTASLDEVLCIPGLHL
ncbi:hypothetical protein ACOJVU_14700, partial [Mycobacterium sp. THU-M104]|uniref:hypothetical protein n=1 Tax=Mycobacterium sp. THU-M104 TaxID=3410515 RepID=UPI003B9BD08E